MPLLWVVGVADHEDSACICVHSFYPDITGAYIQVVRVQICEVQSLVIGLAFHLIQGTRQREPDQRMCLLEPRSRTNQVMSRSAVVIQAPALYQGADKKPSVFLAGPTSGRDWRKSVIKFLVELDIVILNPQRFDWDSTWAEDFSDPRWTEQVNWEMDMRETADVVAFMFDDAIVAPITLLELGLSAHSGKVVVCISDGYPKKGNVAVVCQRYNIQQVSSEEALAEAVAHIVRKRG